MEKDTVKITCVNCGKIFIYKIGTYKSRRATYCSTECRTLWQRNPIIPCKTCGKMFYPTNQRRYYCSRACVDYKHNRKIADPVATAHLLGHQVIDAVIDTFRQGFKKRCGLK